MANSTVFAREGEVPSERQGALCCAAPAQPLLDDEWSTQAWLAEKAFWATHPVARYDIEEQGTGYGGSYRDLERSDDGTWVRAEDFRASIEARECQPPFENAAGRRLVERCAHRPPPRPRFTADLCDCCGEWRSLSRDTFPQIAGAAVELMLQAIRDGYPPRRWALRVTDSDHNDCDTHGLTEAQQDLIDSLYNMVSDMWRTYAD